SVLTNLADGRIAAGSRDAVTGSQLFDAKQEIARNRNDLNDLRGGRDGLLSHGLMAAEQGNVIDYGGARLTGVADGVISADSRDVVTGRQLNQTNEMVGRLERSSNSIAIYSDYESKAAQAGYLGVAVGSDAKSLGNGSTAIGSYATAESTNSAAIGRGAWVGADGAYGIAIGSNTNVEAMYGMALGVGSRVIRGAVRSVSLGAESVALEANTLSIGNDYLKRRIVNVANGRNATDAATVGQLRGALATLGGDVDASGNIINPTFNVQGTQQSTLNDALSTLDSAVVTNTTRTERVESQLRAVFQDSPSVRSDGLNQLTFAGANGMVLSNVANGAIAAGSRDAVNGGQLHSMQQQLNGRMDGLEQRIDGQPQAPQSRALTVAAVDSAASSAPAATPAADEPTAPPPSSGDNKVVADAGNAPKSSPQPQADAPKPESPKPQVDTAELEKMLARANEYSDGISREVDARLDKMDKRFNRMAAMTSAQSAMAMNTAGLNTYNRLGAGVGYSEGESAMAVGYQRVLNDKGSATFSLNGAFTNSGERSMGVGVGIGW
uniref:YadA-like family protein n=1 Tax=Stenotrophomonas cyclobalanopsidis TaxID=2771362 RepID=UPI002FDB2E86